MPRIILSLALITMVTGALAFGATNAFFSDTETSTGNVFTAGAIDLKVDNESYYNGVSNGATSWDAIDLDETTKFFDFDDLKPDDYGEDTISLHVETNDAYMCASITLTANDDNGINEPESLVDDTDGPGNGELADEVHFIWWADDGDNVFESDENIISQGPIGALPLNTPYPLTLADSDENIWTGVGGPVPGNIPLYLGKAWCFGDIGTAPIAQDGETDVMSPAGDNDGVGGAGQPEDGGITCDGTLLGNETQTDFLTADIVFSAVQARHNEGFQCEEPVIACEIVESYADEIVSVNQGRRKNGTAVTGDRSIASYALGAPQSLGTPYDNPVTPNSFFALGFPSAPFEGSDGTASIVLSFNDNFVVNGPGPDLKLWEVTGGSNYPDELVDVYVGDLPAGPWTLVGDNVTRDAEIELGAVVQARYVRIVDASDIGQFEDAADGYDLDAVQALNCIVRDVIN